MTSPAPATARQEWVAMWPLPVTVMLGIAGVSIYSYSSGVFLGEITKEFGWTRAQFSSAFTFQMLVGILFAPIAGRLVDRYGSRRIIGSVIVPQIIFVALLGLVQNSVLQWQLQSTLLGITGAFAAPAIWMAVVVRRFDASRGLAVAVSLAGLGFASMIWPIISAQYVQLLGWRLAFPALAASFAVVILPLIYFFLYGDAHRPKGHVEPARTTTTAVMPALRSRTFMFVAIAGGLYGAVTLGLNFHFVALMRAKGFDLTTAAMLTGTIGLASFCGRLGTGFLLDRLPTRVVGPIAFLVPIIVVGMLLGSGSSFILCFLAAILFGLASGAETDIITYIIARSMPDIFGTAFAVVISIVGVCASMGPLLAGAIYDRLGSYDVFLLCIIPAVSIGALLIWLLPPLPPRGGTPV